MSKYTRKRKNKGVARYATPEQRCKSSPPLEALKTLSSAESVLTDRHAILNSWAAVSWELGGINRGTLSAVASGGREPSKKLIEKLNSVYGCHLHPKQVKIIVDVCPLCGGVPKPRHHCPGSAPKYAPHPVMRLSKIKRILNSPYKDS